MSDTGAIQMHLTGSPSVESIAAAVTSLSGLIDAAAGRSVPVDVSARCRCDSCGAVSEPVDLTDPDAAEAALLAAGWVRDRTAMTDSCPSCARGRS